MNEEQIKSIRFFIERPGMFISELEQKQTVAFVHELQWGDKEILLTKRYQNYWRRNIKLR